MNKQELLNDIDKRVIRTIKVEKQSDTVKEDAGVTSYVANVLNKDARGSVKGQNIGFYVVDEDTENERAYYRDNVGADVSLHDETVAFIAQLPFVKVKVEEINESEEFVIARAYEENQDGDLVEKRVMLYKDSEGTPTFKVLT